MTIDPPSQTDRLLERLAADLRPVRRLPPPSLMAIAWLALATLAIGAAVAVFGLRHDIAERASMPHEVGQWLASVATGIAAAFAAFQLSLADRSPRWALLPLPFLLLWVSMLGLGCIADLARLGPQAWTMSTSWGCLRFIAGIGIPLAGVMLLATRHAGPIRPVPVTLLGGLAAASLCSAGLSLFHHLDAALMVLTWHGLGVIVVLLAASLLGPRAIWR